MDELGRLRHAVGQLLPADFPREYLPFFLIVVLYRTQRMEDGGHARGHAALASIMDCLNSAWWEQIPAAIRWGRGLEEDDSRRRSPRLARRRE